jgi:hypothetical protein
MTPYKSQLFPNVSEDPAVSFFEVNESDPQEATIGDIRKGIKDRV